MTTVHLIISGKVQGVFYRASAKKMADDLHIYGWVKNSDEGHVEAMVCGEQEAVDTFIEWCKKGPDDASVDDVIVTEIPGVTFDGFQIL